MLSRELPENPLTETKVRQQEADKEFAHELLLLGELETGECRLEIDSRHHTVTIKKADSGKVVFHTSIGEYEQLLEERAALRNEPVFNEKQLGGDN